MVRKVKPAIVAVLLGSFVCFNSAAYATPPDSDQPFLQPSNGPAQCVPYLGDIAKGVGQFPLGLVPPDYSNSGYDKLDVVAPELAQKLPHRVEIRDNSQGFNQKIEVALLDGDIFVRNIGDQQWRHMPMPTCLQGHIIGISVNDDALVALDKDGWLYTETNLLSSPDRWGWIRAWGSPVWLGPGHRSPTTAPYRWSLSVIGNHTDRWYDMPDGKKQPISLAKVTQVLALSDNGQHLYTLDPWLANDYSYEVGLPFNSRFIAESISASGSVIFITNKYGDMYTRLDDFDIKGSDPVQFRYQWGADPRPAADNALIHRVDESSAPISLPLPEWQHQPKIPGRITNRISIHSNGPGTVSRELRVEGLDSKGSIGYWSKKINDLQWTFHATEGPVKGNFLENSSHDRSQETLGEESPYNYQGYISKGITLNIENFSYSSPSRVVKIKTATREYPLILHSIDGRMATPLSMRTLPVSGEFGARPSGLAENVPRNYFAAFEIPEETQAAAKNDTELSDFINGYLKNDRYHEIYLKVTPSRMIIINPPEDKEGLLTNDRVSIIKSDG